MRIFLLIAIFTLSCFCNSIAQVPYFKTVVTTAYHTAAIKSDGTLWTWGDGLSGALGHGDNTSKTTPAQVGTDADWVFVCVGGGNGEYTLAIKSNGTLWSWGDNADARLGHGDLTNRNVPTQVGTETDWKFVSTKRDYVLAIKTDKTLWAWGKNNYGQLGDGTTVNKTVPTKIGTASNWVSASAASDHGVAIKSDGTLWAWGNGASGQLGQGSSFSYFSPVQVGSASNWISCVAGGGYNLAIRTNGSLWACGRNDNGQLGDGAAVDRNVFAQIGILTNWEQISTGASHSAGIKSDGTLWTWGRNTEGQLGDGSKITRNSPMQIGTANDWVAVSAGFYHTMALKSNGTLWAWGSNIFGMFGDGTTSEKLTPTLITGGPYFFILPSANSSGSSVLGQSTLFFNENNNLIASVASTGASPASGSATAKVWLASSQPAQYVRRHYEITPTNDATTATGRVTLYFTNQEFKDFNSQFPAPALLLPDIDDPATVEARKANLLVEKRGGTSGDNSGLPDTYSGSVQTINPEDANIVWNSLNNRWEVSFSVVGFSGFFIKTQADVLPVTFGDISAYIKGGNLLVNFTSISEENNDRFIIEASADGKNFNEIGVLKSTAKDGNSDIPVHYTFSLDANSAGIAAMLGFGLFSVLCFATRRNRGVFFAAAVICAVAFISCNKANEDVSINADANLYIRIAQVDKDGTKSYSKIVKAVAQ